MYFIKSNKLLYINIFYVFVYVCSLVYFVMYLKLNVRIIMELIKNVFYYFLIFIVLCLEFS